MRSGNGVLADPDTFMRLAVLEHQLTTTSLTTYVFARDNAPFGMQIHWTLPFDLLVAGLASPLAPFLGWHAALAAAAQAIPFVSLAGLAVALATICRTLGRRDDAPWAIAIAAASPLIIGYATLGMVNHHILAVALGLLAIAAALRLLRTMRPRQGAWAAFWCVVAVWESLECDLPLLLATAIIGAAALQRRDRGGLRVFALLSPVLALLALLLDPPPEGRWHFSADRFSLLQVTMFAAIAIAILLARREAARQRRVRGAAAAAAILFGWAVLALFLARPIRPDDAGYSLYFWNAIAELQPGWSSFSLAVSAAFPTIIGVAIAASQAWRRRSRLWSIIAALLGFELLAGFASVRLATHGAALSAILVAAAIRSFLVRRGHAPEPILLAFCAAGILGGTVAIAAGLTDRGDAACAMGPNTAADLARALPPAAIVAADLWTSPEILWRTRLRTIAGPYHRNWSGIEDLARIFRGIDDAAIRAILARRDAAAVVICATPANVGRDVFPAGSLARRLATNRIPDWLRPVPERPGDNPDLRMFLLANPPAIMGKPAATTTRPATRTRAAPSPP